MEGKDNCFASLLNAINEFATELQLCTLITARLLAHENFLPCISVLLFLFLADIPELELKRNLPFAFLVVLFV